MREVSAPKRTNLLARLPDIPRWVEARDLLLDGEAAAFGLDLSGDLSVVLRDLSEGTIFVIGQPADSAVRAAEAAMAPLGDVICDPADADRIAALIPGLILKPFIVHVLNDESVPPPVDAGVASFIEPSRLDPAALGDELYEELSEAANWTRIGAGLADGQPVAFCYAGSLTESLWDVSINTLPQYRRAGHAARAAALVIGEMATTGRRPVWAALVDNPPSWRLAAKLGFREVDRMVLFERDSG